MKLTDPKVRNAKAEEKPYKLRDEKGLYLLVNKKGAKYWRMDYRFAGKRKTLALGVYPEVSLKKARSGRDKARLLIAENIDPMETRRESKQALVEQVLVEQALVEAKVNTFEAVARVWLAMPSAKRSEKYRAAMLRRFELHVFPRIGKAGIDDIDRPDVLTMLHDIQAKGTIYLAHRVRMNCSQVFEYAVGQGKATKNPPSTIKEEHLITVATKHHASITDPKELGGLLRALEAYSGHFVTLCALRLAPHVFLRPSELGSGEWANIDFDKKEWVLPPKQMKGKKNERQKHIVPLSSQVLLILKELQTLTGHCKYLFPSIRTASRSMSENTINAALRRMDYTKEEMTCHGFRSTATTLLNEQGWGVDAVERQLDHVEGNSVRAAYNYAQYMPERIRMMQHWSNYLDGLRLGADVIAINRAG